MDDTYETPGGEFLMERFGDGQDGVYFTLRSHCRRYEEAIVFIDVESLGMAEKEFKPVELVEDRDVIWDVHDRYDARRCPDHVFGNIGTFSIICYENRITNSTN